MKMRHLHWLSSLLLLLIFLGSKSLEYHTVTHMDGDRAECEWCDFALLLQVTPFEPAPESTAVIVVSYASTEQVESAYSPVFFSSDLYFRNFGRPPPSLS